MEVGIVGTVGIPANYGGFETLTEFLTQQLGQKLRFTVFCSSKAYPSKLKNHNNANLIYIPLAGNGIQSILYDIISIFKAAKTCDTIIILGVSGCIVLPIFRLFYKYKKIIINIDGLEYLREKWNKYISKFLKYSERLAIKHADIIITDNKVIKNYVLKEYNKDSVLIAYGGDHAKTSILSEEVKNKYALPHNYAFKVCRIEPENNIHVVLDAFSKFKYPLVIIGNWQKSNYGITLKVKYSIYDNLYLLDPIYDQNILDQIRSNSKIYIHGHSAGGTNPSLVEAMSLGLPVFAFDVPFNRATTFYKARYFKSDIDLLKLLSESNPEDLTEISNNMLKIAQKEYTWENIAQKYYDIITTNYIIRTGHKEESSLQVHPHLSAPM
jgi:glycosyltransferase involved in cell wall biosynthesis